MWFPPALSLLTRLSLSPPLSNPIQGTSFKFGYALTKLFEGGGEAAAPKPTFVFGSPVAAAAPETTANGSALATPVAAPAAPMADETDDPSPRQPSPPVFNFGSAS